ncbi:ImmA/IrrE family metallo-endopeptidase [Macrococcus capreoli]|uniref:ImmA/IrrE family metallo-endopeptidase n=1 Tax=Macrococcus capreoli TaxID=2982690 RepID=UPI0021D5C905|nr:ImmA/IrrE family metallo-endopeptidase [Macrococcus sp. TMW 2.2395]MCU7557292.1 ImmA/IrrE family metallo-endopeptidase [Macrococcus sp. TMW 2.2395]
MWIEDLYYDHGIKNIDDLTIDNVAEAFNISLFKNWSADVRIQSNDVDIIMLRQTNIFQMTESFFHEFAHVLCHGHTHLNESYRKYCEGQANKLMYELAIPKFMIREEHSDYKVMSRTFKVSEKFALKRIEQLKNNINIKEKSK